VRAQLGGASAVSHQRDLPFSAKMIVMTASVIARIDVMASADSGPGRRSAFRQAAAAWSHSGSNPVPAVQANVPLSARSR
jgi:hypothetical protein